MPKQPSILSALAALALGTSLHAQEKAEYLNGIPAAAPITYTGNRAPLAGTRLAKLPIGSIRPAGWLRHMLELERDGMVGHLEELSEFLKPGDNAWQDPQDRGKKGWEELPYWLKGYGDLGYVLDDPQIIASARKWIQIILASQADDGWLGPRSLLTAIEGKPDLWPNMVVLNVLQSAYEYKADPRILQCMSRYFRWELNCPDADFMKGYWAPIRAGDNLESIYWLYNRTGEPWLLELAAKVHRHTANWSTGVPDWHGVNIAQGFREPAIWSLQQQDPLEVLVNAPERNYQIVRNLYGQVPGGMYGADENCRKGYGDPRQGTETCAIVEFMNSCEMLLRLTGQSVWADRCEDVAFNTFPAALTPDFRGLRYLTSPNLVQADRRNKAPGIQNRGMMLAYSPHEYRCCQHNVAMGWPYYAEHLWLASADGGLCATLYAANQVTATVADGKQITIDEKTAYPFDGSVQLLISTREPTSFPLYLRIPGWCNQLRIQVNGQDAATATFSGSYARLTRTWREGDLVQIDFPMDLRIQSWKTNHNSASIHYGPLTFSLKIGEDWRRNGGTNAWPDWEVYPTTPWNYGLELDPARPEASLELVRSDRPLAPQPFTPDSSPLTIKAKARRIPGWQQDQQGLVGVLRDGPVKSDQPVETVQLIPMGAARLRVSQFPLVSNNAASAEWPAPTYNRISASHCYEFDDVTAVDMDHIPSSSNDRDLPRFTWWDHKGTQEWIEYEFAKPRQISSSDVYWFDDEPAGGGCRVPAAWELQYDDGSGWKPVKATKVYGTQRDVENSVSFEPVTASKLRLLANLQPGFSAGILRWRVR